MDLGNRFAHFARGAGTRVVAVSDHSFTLGGAGNVVKRFARVEAPTLHLQRRSVTMRLPRKYANCST